MPRNSARLAFSWLLFLVLFLVAVSGVSRRVLAEPGDSNQAPEARPNIVLLLADDLGWTGLRCFGSDYYETPNLDRLAASGVKFTAAYSACTVCSPTRASLLTGMYPARLRLTDFIAGQNRPWARLRIPDWTKRLESRHIALAEALREAGYKSGHVGKWHLAPRGGEGGQPVDHGFDEQRLKPPRARGYQLPQGFNREGESQSDYLTDYLTDQAVDMIDQWKDRPFFLYFAYHTPHTPIQGRPDLVARFKAKRDPDAVHNNPEFAAMVHSLDQSVGRILARLRQHRLNERTIVVFLSDNGGLTQRYGELDHFTDNAPLRRGKGSAYEGGVRVPCIVRWPGITSPGQTCEAPIISTDFYPTLLHAAKATGDERHNSNLDGENLVPLLADPSGSLKRDLFWHYPHYHAGGDGPYSAIRSGKWRLIEFHEDQRLELYDLSIDLGERNDVSDEHSAVATDLRNRLHAWRNRVEAQMPTVNPDYDPMRATQVARSNRTKSN